jgi:uncharacterized coiled-coil DUF342 family protein
MSDILQTIVDAVIEDPDFNDSITTAVKDEISDSIREDVKEEVAEALREFDISDKVQEAVEDAVGNIRQDHRDFLVEVQGLRETIDSLIQDNSKLVDLISTYKIIHKNDISELSKLIRHTRDTLRSIPIIKRYFS